MAYSTPSLVMAENTGRSIGTTTKPNIVQVTQWIDETAGVLDGILRAKGYSVPVSTTATSAYKLLEHYNTLGGAAFVEQSAQASDRKDEAMALWREAQKMLREGIVELDAARDADASKPRANAEATAFFTRAMEF